MILQWMVYSATLGILPGVAALAAEDVLRQSRPGRSAPVLLLALGTLGCADQVARSALEPVLATVDLELGELEGAGPEVFGRISGLLGDDAGRIFVADYQAAEVRVFEPDGRHAFTFGRGGSGPGELLGPCCLAWDSDGHFWVRDGANQRYSAYQLSDGNVVDVGSRRMAHTDVNRFAPLTFTRNGGLVDVGSRTSPDGETELVRFILGSESEIVRTESVPSVAPSAIGQHTITREIEGGIARFYFYQPFAPRHLVAHGPGGRWAYGLGSTYTITLVDPDTTMELVGDAERPRLSAAELEVARKRIEEDATRAGISPSAFPYGIPERKPPLQALFFDVTGRLWVEHSVPDGDAHTADVWDETGQLVAQVRWPEDVSISTTGWVGNDWALGVRRDSLGVQHVVRLRFRL